MPKLLAPMSIAAPFIVISAFLSSQLAFLGDMGLGLVTSQAIGMGLAYIVLWEGFFSGYVTGVRLLSIRTSRSR